MISSRNRVGICSQFMVGKPSIPAPSFGIRHTPYLGKPGIHTKPLDLDQRMSRIWGGTYEMIYVLHVDTFIISNETVCWIHYHYHVE